jgi:hypothetical protein
MSLSINASTFIPSLIPLPSSPLLGAHQDELELRDRHSHLLEADINLLESHIEHMLKSRESPSKNTTSVSDDITPDILAILSGKVLDKLQILKCIKDSYPMLTTSDINSKLYSLKNKGAVCQIRGKTNRPLWTVC